MSTISNKTILQTVTLGLVNSYPTYASPLTVAASGTIDAGTGDAIYGPGTQAWTVVNNGTIEATGTGPIGIGGIDLLLGGSVANLGSAALISGYQYGVYITGASGTVTNSGTIAAAIDSVFLNAGGSVGNAAAGYIRGDVGVYVGAAAGTVTNSGTIEARTVNGSGDGVKLMAGGSVANYTGGLIYGDYKGVYVRGAAGTVTNSGTITGYRAGVALNYGGSVGNAVDGLIQTNNGTAVYIAGTYGTVTNSGTIAGTFGVGVQLAGGGSVANYAVGLIQGYLFGVYFEFTGTVTNAGTIAGTGLGSGVGFNRSGGGNVGNAAGGLIYGGRFGVYSEGFPGAATVTNAGTIAGTVGVALLSGGTVVDSGTISGAGGTAVYLGGTGSSLLVLESGYKLTGAVGGSVSASNTVELGGGLGNALTVNYNGLTLTNFSDVLFGAGGNDTLEVSNTGGTLPVTISGFITNSETIDLTGVGTDGTISSFDSVNHLITITGTGGTETLRLDASDGTSFTTTTDGAFGTDLIVCFCRGTLILTEKGEVAVEALSVGDRVKTLSGASKPIRWIGFGRDLVTRRNSLARPIVVRAGALADNVPRRDLYLTHGHALYFDGALIPVEHLVNHRSILWDEEARVVEYYHIELADHDVLLAEGAPAESYHDAGNRVLFHHARAGSRPGTGRPTCAPVLTGGEIVESVWARLFARAGGQIECATTDDPDLHLVVAGQRLNPTTVAEGVYTFVLAAPPAGALPLCSRSAVPSLLGRSRHEHRRLGVAIRQIILDGAGVMTCLDHDWPPFRDGGCHLPDAGHCWTDGELVLPAALFTHLTEGITLIVHTGRQAMRYPLAPVLTVAA